MKHSSKFLILVMTLFIVITGYPQNSDSSGIKKTSNKIKFDINEIDENGLIGPPDGKRSVAYEFCIPLDKTKRKQVLKIDSSVRFYSGPVGRSGCQGQYLCIGEGGTKEVLLELAKLEYIKQINPCYWE